MLALIRSAADDVSTRNGEGTYPSSARGRPASRRIPSPPECLPRAFDLGRSAVGGMEFRYDFERMGRVLAAIRGAGGSVPEAFYPNSEGLPDPARFSTARERRQAFATSIGIAFLMERTHYDLNSAKRSEARFERLGQIEKMARQLAALIEAAGTPFASAALGHALDHGRPPFLNALVDGLSAAQETAASERTRLEAEGLHKAAIIPAQHGSNQAAMTAGDKLMMGLGRAYEKHIGEKPRIVLEGQEREPCGPFVAFVMEVRRQVDDGITAEAVKKGWDRLGTKT